MCVAFLLRLVCGPNLSVCLPQDAFARMPPLGSAFSLEADFFPALVAAGALYGFKCSGHVVDIGTPTRYEAAQSKRLVFQ